MNRTVRWLRDFLLRSLPGSSAKLYRAGEMTEVFACADGALVDILENRDIEGAIEGENFEFVEFEIGG